jgi:general secretion pathway protein D
MPAARQAARSLQTGASDGKALDGMVALNFPSEVEVRGLVDYVSQRLGVKILYDDQIANKKISIKGPGEVPASSLLQLLESALKMKGMALEDADVPGWKRIVASTKLPQIARTEEDTEAVIEKYGTGVAVTQAFVLSHADPPTSGHGHQAVPDAARRQ